MPFSSFLACLNGINTTFISYFLLLEGSGGSRQSRQELGPEARVMSGNVSTGPEVFILIIYTTFISEFLLWEGSGGLQTV